MSNGPDEPLSPEEFERQKQERLKNLADPAERKRKEAEAIAKLGLNTLPKATSQELRDRDNAILADKGPRPLLDISEGKKPVPLPKSSLAEARDKVIGVPQPASATSSLSPHEAAADAFAKSQSGLLESIESPPPAASGMKRYYSGGDEYNEGRRWLSPHYDYAAGYATKNDRKGAFVHYVDLPVDHPEVLKEYEEENGIYRNFEASEEVSRGLKPYWTQKAARSVSEAADKAKPVAPSAAPAPSAPLQPAPAPTAPQAETPKAPTPRPTPRPAAQPSPSPPRTVTGARDAATPPTPAANVPPPPTPPRPPTAPAPGSPDEPSPNNRQPWWKRALTGMRSVSNSMFGSPAQPEGTTSEQPKSSSPAWKAAKQVAGGIGMVAAVAALGGVAGIAGVGSVFGFGGEPQRSQDNDDDDNKTILDRNGNWVGGPEPAPKEPETKQRTKQPQQRNWGQWLSQSIGLSTPSGEQQAAGQRRPRQKGPPRSPRSSDPRHAWMNDLLDGAEDQQEPQFTRTPPPPPTLAGRANAAMNWMVRNSGGIQQGVSQVSHHAQNVVGAAGNASANVIGGMAGIAGNMTGAVANIGAGIATRDPTKIIQGVMQLGEAIVTLPSKFKQFGDELLNAKRHLAEHSSSMSLALIQLDADRYGRNSKLAAATSGSTGALAGSQSRLEDGLIPYRAALDNATNTIVSVIQDSVTIGLKVVEGMFPHMKHIVDLLAKLNQKGDGQLPLEIIQQISRGGRPDAHRELPPIGDRAKK